LLPEVLLRIVPIKKLTMCIMKKLNLDEMSSYEGGAGGADCGLAVAGSVAGTILLASVIAAGGPVTMATAGGFFATKLLATASIIGACMD
jgi:hypothetical protein